VDEWLGDQENTLPMRIRQLQDIAAIVRDLGQGVALDVLSKGQVQSIITRFLGEAAGEDDEDQDEF
jgi:hypothetical protein